MRPTYGIVLPLLTLVALAAPAEDGPIAVKVEVAGEIVRVEASFYVGAPPEETWEVLTDFEHMAKFVTNLKSSGILSRSGNSLTIAQQGAASFGPLSFTFESTREIRLTPVDQIRAHMLNGNMKRYDSTTQLASEGAGTRVQFRSEAVPETWLPPIVGVRFIETETRQQLQEMRDEIHRRRQQTARE